MAKGRDLTQAKPIRFSLLGIWNWDPELLPGALTCGHKMGMFGDMHAEADKSTQNGMWVCRAGRDALQRSAAPSAQDLGIHIIQIPFGLELVREGPQMLNLDLASMPLHRTAHDGLGPLFPSLPSVSHQSLLQKSTKQPPN